ncbi:MAG: rhomboid family intramembrane serine protease [Verrucomicrobia bacterium]|nr:rhomboid family intramembrane serine protease [Verrucomicrobiota bacterium]MBO4714500.1 rhomboid family intramembrane serine protease [Verrucomicrobiota bacterium]MBR5606203.1 rhomboid family intramembrane serine protease [Verrucomicrobiota bacterium]MBR5737738.1 rhomboid family intramembrane serine protease [Verrucomicrobiota bacterium]MBR6464633.1 rhomboid family intramembrane serine protease [Verrucomicrobiota bacterium]
MLGDRDYMRPQPPRGRRVWKARELSAVHLLLAINIGVFVCDAVLRSQGIDLWDYLALSLDGLKHGYIWQILTFQFMHAGVLHIFLNLLTLYFIGRILEPAIGKKEFLRLYLISGAVGGLFQIGCSWIAPQHFGLVSVVGASAGVFGVVGAYAALYPYQRLTLLIFFVLPLSLKARTLIYLAAAVALWGMIFPGGDHIAHAAHLGGMVCGILYLRSRRIARLRADGFSGPSYTRGYTTPSSLFKYKIYGGGSSSRSEDEHSSVIDVEVKEDDDFMEKRVDPILDKISKYGIQSLNDEEREILEKAHKRIRKD